MLGNTDLEGNLNAYIEHGLFNSQRHFACMVLYVVVVLYVVLHLLDPESEQKKLID